MVIPRAYLGPFFADCAFGVPAAPVHSNLIERCFVQLCAFYSGLIVAKRRTCARTI